MPNADGLPKPDQWFPEFGTVAARIVEPNAERRREPNFSREGRKGRKEERLSRLGIWIAHPGCAGLVSVFFVFRLNMGYRKTYL